METFVFVMLIVGSVSALGAVFLVGFLVGKEKAREKKHKRHSRTISCGQHGPEARMCSTHHDWYWASPDWPYAECSECRRSGATQ